MRWQLDGAVLHLFDIPAGALAVATGVEAALEAARGARASALYAELLGGDPAVDALQAAGFEIDYEEPEVAGGILGKRLGLVKLL